MYLGKIVETAPTARLFATPRHPYTKALLAAIPSTDPEKSNVRYSPRMRCQARSTRRPAVTFTHVARWQSICAPV